MDNCLKPSSLIGDPCATWAMGSLINLVAVVLNS
jgi:hypothetical protein